jgi:hypothetical protein
MSNVVEQVIQRHPEVKNEGILEDLTLSSLGFSIYNLSDPLIFGSLT